MSSEFLYNKRVFHKFRFMYDEPLAIELATQVAIMDSLFVKLNLKICWSKGYSIRNRLVAFHILCLNENHALVQEPVHRVYSVILVL